MTDFAQVSVTPDQLTIVPAEQAVASIFVQNTSNVVDVFTIEVLGLDESWVELSVNSVALFPGDSATSDLTLRVPRSSNARAGAYPFTVKVASRKDPSINAEVEGILEVAPYYDVSVELHPQQLTGANGVFTASLTNSGNTDIQISLNGTDPQDALNFTYSRQTPQVGSWRIARGYCNGSCPSAAAAWPAEAVRISNKGHRPIEHSAALGDAWRPDRSSQAAQVGHSSSHRRGGGAGRDYRVGRHLRR